ncbi:MAG: ArgE/DapE family deacylase [Balneolaceae bacterium]|nr:ArgE/DapE family deacylase [Balneolaceae bacterium]
MIDKNFTIHTLQKLVQINSVNPMLDSSGAGEENIGRYIYSLLIELGIESEITELKPGRVNVTGIIRGEGSGKSLMINAHMDTVGIKGMDDPFSGAIKNGKLYGRGAYDMKGSIAAMLSTAKAITEQNLKLNGDLVFSFVADEEYESAGASELIKTVKTDAAIVTEPTNLAICTAHRGFGIFKITTFGQTAHGGNHHIGVDANMMMGLLLSGLSEWADRLPLFRSHPLCGDASVHVPLIKGGRSLFVYSHECTIHVERRTVPGETQESVTKELQQLIESVAKKESRFNADIETILWRSPYEISAESDIVKTLDKVVTERQKTTPDYIGHTWWEDSAIFGEAGIETIIIGPKGNGIHEDVEWVDTDSVYDLAEILLRTATTFCK